MMRDPRIARPVPLGPSLLLAAALVAATGYVRLVVFPYEVTSLAQGLPLLVCIWLRRRAVLWGMTLALLAVAAVKVWVVLPSSQVGHAIDFGLRLLSLLITAGVTHAVIELRARLERHNAQLQQLNQELETANEELKAREEEIAQQNEELQCQTEELEQQSAELLAQTEELGSANNEASRREALLHAIMQASRAHAAAEHPLSEICRRAVPLMGEGAAAAAVIGLEPDGGARVYGQFGCVAGPECAGWSYERSFASLIVERGETGYLEDIALRPDLQCLEGSAGDPFRSLLAAPLRMRGQIMGVVEIFSRQPRRWTVEQFRLIEWLADQCALLLDALQLRAELERRRTDAEQASIRKTRFLAAVSHDIRTPANAITLISELILRAAADPRRAEEVAGLVRDLRSTARGLVELVTEVLDIARFDSGRHELDISEFPLQVVVRAELRRFTPLAEEKRLRLTLDDRLPDVQVRTDRLKLARILANLIGNAVKFTDCGFVNIAICPAAEDGVQVRVQDSGVGISAEHLASIFDEFFQIKNPERDPAKGTGLGLAICKRLVDQLGALLSVESTLGVGTTFSLTLPHALLAAGAEPTEAPPAQAQLGQPARARDGRLRGLEVLLVEDHELTRRATAGLLTAEGAHVVQAPRGGTAIQALQYSAPDVLLLDLMLPDMDGSDVLRLLQESRPSGLRQVLVVTGDASEGRRREVMALGADDVINKPVDAEALVARLAQLVHEPAPAEDVTGGGDPYPPCASTR